MMSRKILWIEGKRAESPHFVPGLRRRGYQIELTATGNEALNYLTKSSPNLVVINVASLYYPGKRIARSIRKRINKTPILMIVNNDYPIAPDPCVDEYLCLPFTPRKLLNRIEALLPGESENILQNGPIKLDIDRRRVCCEERVTSLTPRLTELLSIFLNNPGVVLEREALFRQVWKTEYTEDTRTLDVHVSWLRKVLEEEPRNPRFLQTIRGVGYRLDV